MLVMLAIKNESYKESAADKDNCKQRPASLFSYMATVRVADVEDKQKKIDLPFRGRGILGSGWQRQTCPDNSPDPADGAPVGTLESVGLFPSTDPAPFTSASKDAIRFLGASSLVCWTGLKVGVVRASRILLLFRNCRPKSTSMGE